MRGMGSGCSHTLYGSISSGFSAAAAAAAAAVLWLSFLIGLDVVLIVNRQTIITAVCTAASTLVSYVYIRR